MVNVIKAEYLKFKGTFTRKFVVMAPLFFVIYGIIQKLYLPQGYLHSWDNFLQIIFNWWPLLFVPLGISLLAVLTSNHEKKSGNYRGIRVHKIKAFNIWLGKVLIMAFHTLIASIILILVTALIGLFIAKGSIPWSKIIIDSFVIWLTSLSIIPLYLWSTTWKGTVLAMVFGIVGLVAGVIGAITNYWFMLPWSIPLRIMCPLVGVHPNGVPLKLGDPLLDPSIIGKGIIFSVVYFIAFTFISALWFNRREVK